MTESPANSTDLARRHFLKTFSMAGSIAGAVTGGLMSTSAASAYAEHASATKTNGAARSAQNITQLSALELSAAIRARQVSCVEVMDAYLTQIIQLNPTYNAIVSLADPESLLEQAEVADAALTAGRYAGWMHGFPHAVKDLSNVAGFITSKGSPLYAHQRAGSDDIFVERIKAAGAIMTGKTNTPEFGLGSQTYNPVFGTTLNPWDGQSTVGGSSGGAAATLALQMAPVADGSDLMGSLRNPAAYNNVIGFRPTPGRVPLTPLFIEELPCNGPMGRTVRDTAMLLSTMAGYDPRSPTSLTDDPMQFTHNLARDWHGTRIGWLGNFAGYLPMEPGVLSLCETALGSFEAIGCVVDEAVIDFPMDSLWQVWLAFRHWLVAGMRQHDYADPARRAQLKPECIWEIEGGQQLNAQSIFNASVERARFYTALLTLFERFDFLVLPAAQVFPFDASIPWPKEIAGHQMDTYHRWMEIVVPGTLSGCPIAAVPAGFSPKGLPMGLQIIGPRFKDFATLQMAYAYEQASRWNLDYHPKPIN